MPVKQKKVLFVIFNFELATNQLEILISDWPVVVCYLFFLSSDACNVFEIQQELFV